MPLTFSPIINDEANILAAITRGDRTLFDLAEEHGTTVANFAIWLQREDIQQKLNDLTSAGTTLTRVAAVNQLPKAVKAMAFQIEAHIFDRTHNLIKPGLATDKVAALRDANARKACNLLLRLARFDPSLPLYRKRAESSTLAPGNADLANLGEARSPGPDGGAVERSETEGALLLSSSPAPQPDILDLCAAALSVARVYTGESTGGTRETIMAYDSRDRLRSVKNPLPPNSFLEYDNLDRVTAAAEFGDEDAPSSIDDVQRGRYVEVSRSQRGLVYRTRLAINPADLEDGFLEWHRWFDDVGRVAASWGPDLPTSKAKYDRHGRVVTMYATDRNGDARPGLSGSHDDAMNVEDDHVFEESHYSYDEDWGAPTFVEHIVRAHSAALAEGPLATSGTPTTGVATYAGMMYDSIGRMIRRVDFGTNKAPGTGVLDDSFSNGGDPRDGSPALWPPSTWDPEDYETQLVSEVAYDARGRVSDSKNPMGRITRTAYDDLDQVIATIENAVTIDASDIIWDESAFRWRVLIPTSTDQDRVTSYALFKVISEGDPVWRYRQVAHVPADDPEVDPDAAQITEYRFGITTTGSLLNSNEIIGEVRFPDRDGGQPGADAIYRVTHTYNRLGESRTVTDQNGTLHTYGLDVMGRVLSDAVTFADPDDDVDKVVKAISAQYDVLGRLTDVRSLGGSEGTDVLDHVRFTHTPLGQVEDVIQDVDSEIGASGGLDSRTVSYDYHIEKFSSNPSLFQGNKARLEFMHYPEVPFASSVPTRLEFEYLSGGATGHEVDEPIGRPSRLNLIDDSSSMPLAEYGYVGLSTPSLVDLTLSDVQLDRTADSTGARRYGATTSQAAATYPGWDRFGRTKRQSWVAGDFDVNGSGVPNRREHVSLAFGYNKNSNPTYRQNAQLAAGYGSRWADRDWVYTHDGLDRLTMARRGVLSTSTTNNVTPDIAVTSPMPAGSQKWTLDHLGNWSEFAIDLNGDTVSGLPDFTGGNESQSRAHNDANEIGVITPPGYSLPTTPAGLVFLAAPLAPPFAHTHDNNGSRVESQQVDSGGDGVGHKFVYDAWNRLVAIKKATLDNHEGTYSAIAEYRYNGLHWRTYKKAWDSPGATTGSFRRFTYSAAWQPIVEEIDDNYGETGNEGTDRVAQQVWGIRGINDALYRREDAATYVPEAEDPGDPEGPPIEAHYDPGADGIFEKSFYQLTDPQFSVMALVNEAGAVIEQLEYDPYGRVRRTPLGDFNHDGELTTADIFAFYSAFFAGSAAADYDWDGLSGSSDVPDLFAFLSAYFAGEGGTRDELSSTANDNPIGYCGYYHDRETVGIMGAGNGGLYQVRHRVYDPHAGRWLQRDPAGFVDGCNLYNYVRGAVALLIDPFGLACNGPDEEPQESMWDRAKKAVHDGLQALSNTVADSDLPQAAKDALMLVSGAIDAAASAAIDSNEEQMTTNPVEATAKALAAPVQSAIQKEENHARRAGRDFSMVSAVHEWLADQSGGNDLAAGFYGYDSSEDRAMTGEERFAATARGFGTTTLICVGCGRAANSAGRGGHFSGTAKPWLDGATPNSKYTQIHPKTGKALKNAIYDSDGKIVGHVDFDNHRGSPSGHGHSFPEPGNPSSGHGPGRPHIPYERLPPGWGELPPGVEPQTPIGG